MQPLQPSPGDCKRCHTPTVPGALFCQACGLFLPDDTGTVERVTYTRRFFGDYLLEGVLRLATLLVGWYVWLAFTAPTAQSPAKRLLKVYVIDTDTLRAVGAGRIWVREFLVKQLLVGLLSLVTGIGGLVDALWVFPDKKRQALHDKVVSTVVVYAPYGLPEKLGGRGVVAPHWAGTPSSRSAGLHDIAEQMRELTRLRDEGIITPEEYERKRSDLVGKL